MYMFLPDESEEIIFVLCGRLMNFSCYQRKFIEEREMSKWISNKDMGVDCSKSAFKMDFTYTEDLCHYWNQLKPSSVQSY